MICFLFTFRFIFLFFIFWQCALRPVLEQCTQERNCWHCQGFGRGIKHPIPTELKNLYHGCRAGAKLKEKRHNRRWRYKPLLSSVVDFGRSKTPCQSVCIDGGEIETAQTCKYLWVVLDNKLEWSANIETVYRRGQSRLFFLRWLRSFNVCSDMMCMFYHTVIESALFYAVVCWGSCTTDKNCGRLDKLVKKRLVLL